MITKYILIIIMSGIMNVINAMENNNSTSSETFEERYKAALKKCEETEMGWIIQGPDGEPVLVDPTVSAIMSAVDQYNYDQQLKKLERAMTSEHFAVTQKIKSLNDLQQAARDGDERLVQNCLQQPSCKIDEEVDEMKYTALILAAFGGHTHIVTLLLEHKADINKRSFTGKTPLFYAASKNKLDVVRELLKHKNIEVDACDAYGVTPLQIACQNGCDEIMKALIHAGASENIKNSYEGSARDAAQMSGLLSVLESEIETRATNAQSQNIKTQEKDDAKGTKECSICLDPINEPDVQFLSCTHSFHKACVDRWFVKNNTCPMCRNIQK